MENVDFDSDDSVVDPTYTSDDTPTSSRLCKGKTVNVLTSVNKKLKASVSPASCNQDETHGGEKNVKDEMRGANSILFSKYFQILRMDKREGTEYLKKMKGVLAQCKICFQNIKGSLYVSSNFIRHLRTRHRNVYEQYERKKKCSSEENSIENFDNRVLMFLAATCSPLSLVEKPEFQNLFKGFPIKLKSRRVMTNILGRNIDKWMLETTAELNGIQFYCTTADIWSSRQRSFFGYTCHYIAPDTFERKHLALACRRFTEAHTYERITEMVNNIHTEFEMDNSKIVLSITDNGSNFCKAYKEFGVPGNSIQEDSDSDNDDEMMCISNAELTLPNHFRCASHTLNLLSSTDFLRIIKGNSNILFRHNQALARCSNIWNKCNRPKSAEAIQTVLGAALKTPTVTRWNSLYDSVKCLLTHKDKLPILCTNLGISKFSPLDVEYLERYIILMEPIADALDFLQGENHMYFGYFIATIISLKVKLTRLMNNNSLGELNPVCGELKTSLIHRFEVFFKGGKEAELALLAGMSHPAVKLRFLPILQETAPRLTVDGLKQFFVEHACLISHLVNKETITPKSSQNFGFLDFGEINRSSVLIQQDNIQNELETFFLDTDTSTCCLNKYPLIRQMYLKFNTPLPSSAPVERLFSFAGLIDVPRRNKLSDTNFEKLVLLKANSC